MERRRLGRPRGVRNPYAADAAPVSVGDDLASRRSTAARARRAPTEFISLGLRVADGQAKLETLDGNPVSCRGTSAPTAALVAVSSPLPGRALIGVLFYRLLILFVQMLGVSFGILFVLMLGVSFSILFVLMRGVGLGILFG